MQKTLIVLALMVLTACAVKNDPTDTSAVGLANPASVYCQKMGGKLEIVKEEKGEVGYCTLPGGERIEEWGLYRRDNQ